MASIDPTKKLPEDRGFKFIGAIWDRVSGFFALQWKDFWSTFLDVSVKFNDDLWDRFVDRLNKMDDPLWDETFNFLIGSKMITPEQKDFLIKFKDLPPPINFLVWTLFASAYLNYYMFAVADQGNEPIKQEMAAKFQSTLPDVNSLVRAAFIAPERVWHIKKLLQKHGFSEQSIDYLFLSNYRLYDVEMIRTLWLRKILTNDQLYERMRELGFTDTRIEEITQSFEVIPGPSDLFHLVGKEAFEPETIEKLGLGAEFPNEQLEWLDKQGINKYWAEKYWYAHWYQPSIQQGMQMYHRFLITDEELDLLFRAQELPPFWREKIKGITYLPYTRVDLRRLWKEGIITDELEVYKEYRWQGYDHEHALNLTKFAITDAETSERDITLGQIMKTYEDKLITREQAKKLLVSLRYSESKAEFLLTGKDFEIATELQGAKIKLVEEKYTRRIIDKFTALRDLHLLDLTADHVHTLLEKWDLKLLKDNKLPSKTDLVKFWKVKLIKDDEYLNGLELLGYKKDDALRYLNLLKKEREGKKEILYPSKEDLNKFWGAKLMNDEVYLEHLEILGYKSEYTQMYLKLLKGGKEKK